MVFIQFPMGIPCNPSIHLAHLASHPSQWTNQQMVHLGRENVLHAIDYGWGKRRWRSLTAIRNERRNLATTAKEFETQTTRTAVAAEAIGISDRWTAGRVHRFRKEGTSCEKSGPSVPARGSTCNFKKNIINNCLKLCQERRTDEGWWSYDVTINMEVIPSSIPQQQKQSASFIPPPPPPQYSS